MGKESGTTTNIEKIITERIEMWETEQKKTKDSSRHWECASIIDELDTVLDKIKASDTAIKPLRDGEYKYLGLECFKEALEEKLNEIISVMNLKNDRP